MSVSSCPALYLLGYCTFSDLILDFPACTVSIFFCAKELDFEDIAGNVVLFHTGLSSELHFSCNV